MKTALYMIQSNHLHRPQIHVFICFYYALPFWKDYCATLTTRNHFLFIILFFHQFHYFSFSAGTPVVSPDEGTRHAVISVERNSEISLHELQQDLHQ